MYTFDYSIIILISLFHLNILLFILSLFSRHVLRLDPYISGKFLATTRETLLSMRICTHDQINSCECHFNNKRPNRISALTASLSSIRFPLIESSKPLERINFPPTFHSFVFHVFPFFALIPFVLRLDAPYSCFANLHRHLFKPCHGCRFLC